MPMAPIDVVKKPSPSLLVRRMETNTIHTKIDTYSPIPCRHCITRDEKRIIPIMREAFPILTPLACANTCKPHSSPETNSKVGEVKAPN